MLKNMRKCCGALGAIGWSILCALVMTGLAAVGQTVRARTIMPVWGRGVLLCFGTRLSVSGLELLPSSNYIAAVSHHSLLDTFIYPAILSPETCYIAKHELSKLPIFSRAFRLLGNAFVRRGDGMTALSELMRHTQGLPPQHTVFIHPEGTRGPEGSARPLKLGVVCLACETQKPVVPIVSVGGQRMWPRGVSLPDPGHVLIHIGQPIATGAWRVDTAEAHLREVKCGLDDLFARAAKREVRPR